MTNEEQQPERTTINSIEGLSCSTCFYWNQTDHEPELGRCMRNPPQAIASDVRGKVVSGFPLSRSDDVCGEWKTDAEPPAELGLAEVPPS